MRTTFVDYPTRSMINLSELKPDLFEVNRIRVLDQGKGIGRRLMKEMLEEADRDKITLVLDVNPYGDLDFEALVAWYQRNGFEWRDERLWRDPR